jgi:hypothetical protein
LCEKIQAQCNASTNLKECKKKNFQTPHPEQAKAIIFPGTIISKRSQMKFTPFLSTTRNDTTINCTANCQTVSMAAIRHSEKNCCNKQCNFVIFGEQAWG